MARSMLSLGMLAALQFAKPPSNVRWCQDRRCLHPLDGRDDVMFKRAKILDIAAQRFILRSSEIQMRVPCNWLFSEDTARSTASKPYTDKKYNKSVVDTDWSKSRSPMH